MDNTWAITSIVDNRGSAAFVCFVSISYRYTSVLCYIHSLVFSIVLSIVCLLLVLLKYTQETVGLAITIYSKYFYF